jgi:long-chain fatty acid transport protein
VITRTMKSALAVAIAAASSQAFANGLAINEQSASGAGTSYAGRSSSAQDASTIFGNPAGMSKLERTEAVGGFAIIDAKTDISHADSTTDGTNDGDMVPLAAVPFGYLATPINEKWHFGLGVYVPFGVISDYEKSFQGASHGLYSKVQVITVQPTLSYKINDRVSVGFGPTINRLDGKLTNTLDTSGIAQLVGGNGDAKINIKGDDTAYGYNLGILVDATDSTRLGLTYHSKVAYHLEGRTKISNIPNLPLAAIRVPLPGTLGQAANGRYDAKLDITMPESVDASVTQKLGERWTLYGGATWTRWSRLESLDVQNSGLNPIAQPFFGTVGEELNWRDSWAFAVGAAYQLNPQWVLRTGLALDASPTTNDDRDVRIPVGERKTFTLGAGWSPNQDLTIDVAYAYLWENTASVHAKASGVVAGVTLQPAYDAKYDNSAHGLVAGLTYRF